MSQMGGLNFTFLAFPAFESGGASGTAFGLSTGGADVRGGVQQQPRWVQWCLDLDRRVGLLWKSPIAGEFLRGPAGGPAGGPGRAGDAGGVVGGILISPRIPTRFRKNALYWTSPLRG